MLSLCNVFEFDIFHFSWFEVKFWMLDVGTVIVIRKQMEDNKGKENGKSKTIYADNIFPWS